MNNNKETTNNKTIIITIVITAIVTILVYLILSMIPNKLSMKKFKNLPEANFPATNKGLGKVTYGPKEVTQPGTFQFSKNEVCELDKALRGYFVDDLKDILSGYIKVLNYCKILDCIGKDIPELSVKVNEYKQKIDSIYGPAILQFLFCMDEFASLNKYLPEEYFLKSINSLKATYEKRLATIEKKNKKNNEKSILYSTYPMIYNPNNDQIDNLKDLYASESRKEKFVNRFPFLYNHKYEKNNALSLLQEIEILVGNTGNYKELIHFLTFHPKVLTNDSEYILKNLCCGKTIPMFVDGNYFEWTFYIPKFWDIIISKDASTEMIFYSKLDTISGGIAHFDKLNGVDVSTEEAQINFLKSCNERIEDVKKLLNLNMIDSTKSSIVKLGDKNVLLIEYKSKVNNIALSEGRIYVFLSKYSILVYMFKTESTTENGALERMARNVPLLDGLIAASKLTYR